MNDPIISSAIIGTITFIITIVLLAILKPEYAMKYTNNTKSLNYTKLVLISIICAIGVATLYFLPKMTNVPENIVVNENSSSHVKLGY